MSVTYNLVGNAINTDSPITVGTTGIYSGSGAPSFTAPQGSLYLRTDGGASTRVYSNTAGSTAWSAITSA